MTDQRAELASLLQAMRPTPNVIPGGRWGEAVANQILAAGFQKPRTITTAQELDALPELSVVTDCYVDVWQRRGGEWCSYDTRPMQTKRVVKYAPLTVVWTPPEVLLTPEGA